MPVFVFDRDPHSGAVSTFEYDEGNDRAVIKTITDVEPIIEANKRQMNSGHDGYTPRREAQHVARIPLAVAEQWKQVYGIDALKREHAGAVRKLLNSSEWAYLRTAPGRL